MAYGLQCWRADGSLIIDTSTRGGRFRQRGIVTGNGGNLTVTVSGSPAMANDGTWYVICNRIGVSSNFASVTILSGGFRINSSINGVDYVYLVFNS